LAEGSFQVLESFNVCFYCVGEFEYLLSVLSRVLALFTKKHYQTTTKNSFHASVSVREFESLRAFMKMLPVEI